MFPTCQIAIASCCFFSMIWNSAKQTMEPWSQTVP